MSGWDHLDDLTNRRLAADFDRVMAALDPPQRPMSYEDREHAWEVWQDRVLAFTPERAWKTARCLEEECGFDEAVADLLGHLLCCPVPLDEKTRRLLDKAEPVLRKELERATDAVRPKRPGAP